MTSSAATVLGPRRVRGGVEVDPKSSAGLTSTTSSVLHIIEPGDVGGAETVVRALASAQRARGGRVAVAAVVHAHDSAVAFLDGLRDESIEVHRVMIPGRGYLRECGMVADICQAMLPDLVHTHGYRADIIDGWYLRLSTPTVSTVHGYTGGDIKNRLYEWLQRRALGYFDAVVAVSSPLGGELARTIPRERLHVIPNAVQLPSAALSRRTARAALGLPADAFALGWVGRMSPEKGADVLLDALVQPEVPAETHVAFLGDGPELDSLRRRAVQLSVGSRVHWSGSVPSASRLFAAFDALVLSSRTEGTPMVVLEAMAAEVPIVATRVGGVPDVLPAGTALLVDAEAPAALAAAIGAVFRNPEGARARARAAQHRLRSEYGLDKWASRYENVYQSARIAAAQRL